MDVSARTTMKGAAKCDKHFELQDSVNQQKVERILLFRVIPESMFTSVSFVFSGSEGNSGHRPGDARDKPSHTSSVS